MAVLLGHADLLIPYSRVPICLELSLP